MQYFFLLISVSLSPATIGHSDDMSTISANPAQESYLKEVFLKYIKYVKDGDQKANMLIPVLATCLDLQHSERKLLELEDGGILDAMTSWIAPPTGPTNVS